MIFSHCGIARLICPLFFVHRWGWGLIWEFGSSKQEKWMGLEDIHHMCDFGTCQCFIGNRFLWCDFLHDTRKIWYETCFPPCKTYVSWIKSITSTQCDIKHFSARSLPWNEENLIGYIAETCLLLISLSVYLVTNGAILMLLISLTWILQSFSKIYRHTANKFKHPDEARNDEKTLCNLIDRQNMAREWVEPWNFVLSIHSHTDFWNHRCVFSKVFHATDAGCQPIDYDSAHFQHALIGHCRLSTISPRGKKIFFPPFVTNNTTDQADVLFFSSLLSITNIST